MDKITFTTTFKWNWKNGENQHPKNFINYLTTSLQGEKTLKISEPQNNISEITLQTSYKLCQK